jgi:hypothetical protein
MKKSECESLTRSLSEGHAQMMRKNLKRVQVKKAKLRKPERSELTVGFACPKKAKLREPEQSEQTGFCFPKKQNSGNPSVAN